MSDRNSETTNPVDQAINDFKVAVLELAAHADELNEDVNCQIPFDLEGAEHYLAHVRDALVTAEAKFQIVSAWLKGGES